MKLTQFDKANLFLGAGFLILAVISIKSGKAKTGVCFLIGAFGCGVMFYAAHKDNFINKK